MRHHDKDNTSRPFLLLSLIRILYSVSPNRMILPCGTKPPVPDDFCTPSLNLELTSCVANLSKQVQSYSYINYRRVRIKKKKKEYVVLRTVINFLLRTNQPAYAGILLDSPTHPFILNLRIFSCLSDDIVLFPFC